MLIFMIELITEFIYILLKLMWHQSKSFQKRKTNFSKYIGFEFKCQILWTCWDPSKQLNT